MRASQIVGKNVRLIRTGRGLTLDALSSAMTDAGHPITLDGLSKIERGARRVDVDRLLALARALDVHIGELLDPDAAERAERAALDAEGKRLAEELAAIEARRAALAAP